MAATEPLYIGFVRDTARHVVNARDGLDVATLLPLLFAEHGVVGLLKSFNAEEVAWSWASSPTLPMWVEELSLLVCSTSAVSARPSPDGGLVAFTAILTSMGGFVANKDERMDVVRLMNTLQMLCGETAIVRSSMSNNLAVSWLQQPALEGWAVSLVRLAGSASKEAAVPAVETVVIDSDDSVVEVMAPGPRIVPAGAPAEVQAFAAALPPPPEPKHGPFSWRGMEEASPLRAVVPRRRQAASATRPAPRATSLACSASSLLRRRQTGAFPQSVGGESLLEGGHRGDTSFSTRRSSRPLSTGAQCATPLLSSSTLTKRGDVVDVDHLAQDVGHPHHLSPGRRVLDNRRSCGVAGDRGGLGSCCGAPLEGRPRGIVRHRDVDGDQEDPPKKEQRRHPIKRVCTPACLSYDMDKLGQELLATEKSVFITGGGGVGKTRLLRVVAKQFQDQKRGSKAGLRILAPTGVSAAIAGGVTIHAFLRLPANCFNHRVTEARDAAMIYSSMDKLTKQRLATTELVLLDEVSMVSSRMMTTLAFAMNASRADFPRASPWRMLAFGDFYQLPPVLDTDNEDVVFDAEAGYAFQAPAWDEIFDGKVLHLTYVWRQSDAEFISMLNDLRVGEVSPALSALMEQRQRAYEAFSPSGGLGHDVTHIFPRTQEVLKHNARCLQQLEAATRSKRVSYDAVDRAIGVDMTDLALQAVLDKSLLAPKVLHVCVGARVAMCGNGLRREGVFNGTVGVVTGFEDGGGSVGLPDARFRIVPVVLFSTVNRGMVSCVVAAESMKLESVHRDGPFAERVQVPLVLAWAVTIHRVQGLSLDRAVLDLARCFTAGMVYVALSRIRSASGVFIKSFDESKVVVAAPVRLFYREQASLGDRYAHCLTFRSSGG